MGFVIHPECQKQTALATYGPNSGFQKIFKRSSRRYGVHQVVVLSKRDYRKTFAHCMIFMHTR